LKGEGMKSAARYTWSIKKKEEKTKKNQNTSSGSKTKTENLRWKSIQRKSKRLLLEVKQN
jgi:hypothetical protein